MTRNRGLSVVRMLPDSKSNPSNETSSRFYVIAKFGNVFEFQVILKGVDLLCIFEYSIERWYVTIITLALWTRLQTRLSIMSSGHI